MFESQLHTERALHSAVYGVLLFGVVRRNYVFLPKQYKSNRSLWPMFFAAGPLNRLSNGQDVLSVGVSKSVTHLKIYYAN